MQGSHVLLYQRVIANQMAEDILKFLWAIGANNRIILMQAFAEFLLYDITKVRRKFIVPPAITKSVKVAGVLSVSF